MQNEYPPPPLCVDHYRNFSLLHSSLSGVTFVDAVFLVRIWRAIVISIEFDTFDAVIPKFSLSCRYIITNSG